MDIDIDIISVVLGTAIGIGGMIVKEKILDSKSNDSTQNASIKDDALSNENEKLRRRVKEAENQIEELLAENQKLRRQSKEKDEDQEDYQDELDMSREKIKKLLLQNDELLYKIEELKLACQSYERRINELNKK